MAHCWNHQPFSIRQAATQKSWQSSISTSFGALSAPLSTPVARLLTSHERNFYVLCRLLLVSSFPYRYSAIYREKKRFTGCRSTMKSTIRFNGSRFTVGPNKSASRRKAKLQSQHEACILKWWEKVSVVVHRVRRKPKSVSVIAVWVCRVGASISVMQKNRSKLRCVNQRYAKSRSKLRCVRQRKAKWQSQGEEKSEKTRNVP